MGWSTEEGYFILSGPQRLREDAGVGIVSLRGPLLLCLPLLRQRSKGNFDLGRFVRSVLPLNDRRLVHLVVACGFQGADEDAEKLSLSGRLFDAVMCELAIVPLRRKDS